MDDKITLFKMAPNDKSKNVTNNIKLNPNNKVRNPCIDFLRMLGMIDIVAYHITINVKLYEKYSKYWKCI